MSAVATEDYTPISLMLEFPAGSNADDTQCVNIIVLDSDVFESENETFTVELAVVTLPRVIEGNAETIIYITDNDSK